MSNLPPIDPQEATDDEFLINPNILDPTIAIAAVVDDDESWSSLYQRLLLQPSTVAAPPPLNFLQDSSQIIGDDCGPINEGENIGMAQEGAAGNKGSKLKRRKNSSGNGKRRKKNATNVDSCGNNEKSGEKEDEEKVAKRKMDHISRERVRRMKLNASYLALRALLPPPTDQPRRRSKKTWSAPAIIDRALNYIPELQNKVEALNSQKHKLQAKFDNNNDDNTSPGGDGCHEDDGGCENRKGSITVNKISSEEAIIQISFTPDHGLMKKFIHVMESVESELTCGVKSASTVCVSSHDNSTRIICCHLHIFQKNQAGCPSTGGRPAGSIDQVVSRLQL